MNSGGRKPNHEEPRDELFKKKYETSKSNLPQSANICIVFQRRPAFLGRQRLRPFLFPSKRKHLLRIHAVLTGDFAPKFFEKETNKVSAFLELEKLPRRPQKPAKHAATHRRGDKNLFCQARQIVTFKPMLNVQSVLKSFLISVGRNIVYLIDRKDEEYCFRFHKDKVYYVR